MKFYGKLLTLCAFQSLGSDAFVAPAAKPVKPSFALQSALAKWDLGSISPNVGRIEGESRKTWTFGDTSLEVVQVALGSTGRPIAADIELWIGPDWTPMTLQTYSEDGAVRPIQTLVGTRNKVATIEVRNTGAMEFPLSAACNYAPGPLQTIREEIPKMSPGRYVEGGSVYSATFEPDVEQVQVLLKTDTRQLNAQIELLNGPNNMKQKFKVFTNNGVLNSLYLVLNTPGSGNVVRVTNLAPLEFPCKAHITELATSS
eukprot:CAMPEP_0195506634 /NCGR_PEP_ID=MMETSP0794_2-20130614/215_1 /TAXON_ID=515487 /ORGANISM="Stephanopyxis turris, Strain CCMP 815" /LENGTH=257 /DNA_ID=CAMNT_0040633013 /DNA_START=38 /DNA_END=811 /DNA_ORIENTATION=+